MSKNAFQIIAMDNSEKNKEILFDFYATNLVLKNIFQMNVFLKRIRHLEVIPKQNLVIVLVMGLPPILILG